MDHRAGAASEIEVLASAVRIDGVGKYVMPGVTDMHVHFPVRRYEEAVRNKVIYLANGVTTLLQLPSIPVDFLPLIQHFNSDHMPGPRIYFSALMEEFLTPTGVRLDSIATYLAVYKAKGFDDFSMRSARWRWGSGPTWCCSMAITWRTFSIQGRSPA